jgi:predicted metal-binding membrane protein
MLMTPAWTERYAALVLVMWIVMMAAMMLTSAAPPILQLVGPGPEQTRKSGMASALFLTAGYLAVWIAFRSRRHGYNGRWIAPICSRARWPFAAPWRQDGWSLRWGSTNSSQ